MAVVSFVLHDGQKYSMGVQFVCDLVIIDIILMLTKPFSEPRCTEASAFNVCLHSYSVFSVCPWSVFNIHTHTIC